MDAILFRIQNKTAHDLFSACTLLNSGKRWQGGNAMNCRGCGVELDPTEEQVNVAVDEILESSLEHAERTGGVCPLCGHSKDVPYSNRKTVLFALLLACLVVGTGLMINARRSRQTLRAEAAKDAISRLNANADVVRLLGMPITMLPGVLGEVSQDETGWKESRLTIPVHGPKGDATVHVIGGRGSAAWVITTFEVIIEKQHKKVDLVAGRVVEYDPNTYVESHTEVARVPEYTQALTPAARLDGEFPCVYASMENGMTVAQFGNCGMPVSHHGPVDRFEADLRYGTFVMRQTDLYLNDVFEVPLTRTYVTRDWIHPNKVHAFGRNTNHPFDIAPLGSRNPYTFQMIALEDGDFIYFDRISKGTGYSDAVFQHTETSTRFYKATQSWNGNGWTTKLADGSEIHFPESYNAKNLAQGAPTEFIDAQGNRLELKRDPQRNLQEIRTPHGHWMKFVYDDQSRIVRAEDDSGKWVQYKYNSDGMLTDVVSSAGRERHYRYKQDQQLSMDRITDERGRILVHNTYDNGVLMSQDFGAGQLYVYRYEWPRDKNYPNLVSVTLPDGSVKTVHPTEKMPAYYRLSADSR